MKVSVDANYLKSLAEIARRNGTQDQWIDIALEWIEQADEEIRKLMKGEEDGQGRTHTET